MALLWIEGFEGFGTTVGSACSPTGVLARKYADATWPTYIYVQTGRIAGYACQPRDDNTCYFHSPNLTTDATVVIGCAVKFPVFANNMFLALYDGATLGMNLYLNSTGEISVRRGSTVLETTAASGLATNTWAYLEFKVTCNDTTGAYELRIGGVDKASDTGVDTREGTHDYHTAFRLMGTALAANSMIVDDLYFLDSTGGNNTTFLGDCVVEAIYPDGDTANVDWTRSTGAISHDLVDEAVENDDTDYLSSATSGNKDLFDYPSLGQITGGVRGVQVNTTCRTTDASTYYLISPCKSGATESNDSSQAINSTSYSTKKRVLETDPATSALWTLNAVNAAQFGIKLE